MTLVDAQGRLFGRWNFVDAVVMVLVIGLIPIGYAAYALFRTPAPELVSIEPAEVLEGPERRVTINGVNLRPYLRVSFGTVQGKTFLFEDSRRAVVDLNPLPPGTYDVILYDYGQERHRLPNALTVRGTFDVVPDHSVIVAGRFIDVAPGTAGLLKPGAAVSIPGELLETAAPRPSVPRVFSNGVPVELPSTQELEVPAAYRMTCVVKVTQGFPECGGADFALRPHYIFKSTLPGNVPAPFQIDQVYGSTPVQVVRATVRFVGTRQALAAMSAGDLDVELARNPFSLGARVLSLGPPPSDGQTERSGVLAFRAQRLPSGWWYGPDTVRIASQVGFRTDRYAVAAIVDALSNE